MGEKRKKDSTGIILLYCFEAGTILTKTPKRFLLIGE